MTLMGRATEPGLQVIAQKVLAPHFHQGGSSEKKVRSSAHVMSCKSHIPVFQRRFLTCDAKLLIRD